MGQILADPVECHPCTHIIFPRYRATVEDGSSSTIGDTSGGVILRCDQISTIRFSIRWLPKRDRRTRE